MFKNRQEVFLNNFIKVKKNIIFFIFDLIKNYNQFYED